MPAANSAGAARSRVSVQSHRFWPTRTGVAVIAPTWPAPCVAVRVTFEPVVDAVQMVTLRLLNRRMTGSAGEVYRLGVNRHWTRTANSKLSRREARRCRCYESTCKNHSTAWKQAKNSTIKQSHKYGLFRPAVKRRSKRADKAYYKCAVQTKPPPRRGGCRVVGNQATFSIESEIKGAGVEVNQRGFLTTGRLRRRGSSG